MLSSSEDKRKNSTFKEKVQNYLTVFKIMPSKLVEGLSGRILVQNGTDWLNEDVHRWISCQLILIKVTPILSYIYAHIYADRIARGYSLSEYDLTCIIFNSPVEHNKYEIDDFSRVKREVRQPTELSIDEDKIRTIDCNRISDPNNFSDIDLPDSFSVPDINFTVRYYDKCKQLRSILIHSLRYAPLSQKITGEIYAYMDDIQGVSVPVSRNQSSA